MAAYRYYKFDFTAAPTNYLYLGELELIGSYGVDVTAPGMTVTKSSEYSTYYATNAIDNVITNRWQVNNVAPPWWWKVDLGAGNDVEVIAYNLSVTNISYYASAWTLSGSTDDTNWTVIDTRSGVTSWVANTFKSYPTNLAKTISGTTQGSSGSPISRQVSVYNRGTGKLVSRVLSNATTGVWSVTTDSQEHYAVMCDTIPGGSLNAVILDKISP